MPNSRALQVSVFVSSGLVVKDLRVLILNLAIDLTIHFSQ